MSFIGYSPKSFQFWSNSATRPKRNYEAILIFPDLIFGGEGLNNLDPFLVKSFSRPGYNRIETTTAEYQLSSGDFAKIDYPTNGFTTKPLNVTLMDVATGRGGGTNQLFGITGGSSRGADTAGMVHTSLVMSQKTMQYEQEAASHQPGDSGDSKYLKMIESCHSHPDLFFITEINNSGDTLGTWEIWRPILTSVNFSDIRYDGASFATIDLSFQYSNFKFNHGWSERVLTNKLKQAAQGLKTPIADAMSKAADWVHGAKIPWTK